MVNFASVPQLPKAFNACSSLNVTIHCKLCKLNFKSKKVPEFENVKISVY